MPASSTGLLKKMLGMHPLDGIRGVDEIRAAREADGILPTVYNPGS